jgi:hypothetical protein
VLADLIAWMPCRSSIDRRGPVGRVLRDVRRDVEVAQSPLLAPVISHAPDFARDIALDPAPDSRAGVFRSRIVPRASVARRHGAAMTASSSDASRTCVPLAPKPKDLAPRRTSSPLCPARESRPVASLRVMFCACAGQRQMARAALSKLWRRMAGGSLADFATALLALSERYNPEARAAKPGR